MIPGLSYVKLAGIAAVVIAIGVLFGLWKVAQADARRWQATAQTYAAQRDEAIAANTGLAGQVESLTADKLASDKKSAAAETALALRNAQQDQAITIKEKEIDRAAVKTDDVCSPALAAALGLVCAAGSGPNDHASATH